MDSAILILAAVLFLIWYFFSFNYSFDMVYEHSSYDGQKYLVRNLPDRKEAANMIAYIRSVLSTLVRRLVIAYPQDKRVQLLQKRYHPENIQEATDDSNHTSYSVNKGEKLVFCIRFRDNEQKIVQKNTIVFVALHELAHVLCISQGHTEEFWTSFRFLLAHAIKWKLYTPVNYREKKEPYCGTVITDSPHLPGDVDKFVSFDDSKVDFSSVPLPQSFHVES